MTTTFQGILAAVIVTASVAVAVAASAMNNDSAIVAKGNRLAGPVASSGYLTITTPNAELTIMTRVYP